MNLWLNIWCIKKIDFCSVSTRRKMLQKRSLYYYPSFSVSLKRKLCTTSFSSGIMVTFNAHVTVSLETNLLFVVSQTRQFTLLIIPFWNGNKQREDILRYFRLCRWNIEKNTILLSKMRCLVSGGNLFQPTKAPIINFCCFYSFCDEADLTSGRGCFPFPLLFAHDLDSIDRLAYRVRNFDIIHPPQL